MRILRAAGFVLIDLQEGAVPGTQERGNAPRQVVEPTAAMEIRYVQPGGQPIVV